MRGLLLGVSLALAVTAAQAQEPSGPIQLEAPTTEAQTAETPTAGATAIDAVRALYDLPTAPRRNLAQYFAPDIAEALEADLAQRMPTVSPDYRFDTPSRPRGEVTFAETQAPNGAGVMVGFNGQQVLVELCRRRDGGWRITDIRDPDEFWGTRAYLLLPGGHVRCDR